MDYRALTREEIPPDAKVPAGAFVMGAVSGDEVVAVLGAFPVIFLDPLWVAPSHRPWMRLRELWRFMRSRLGVDGVPFVVCHADSSQPTMAALLQRIGGVEITGKRQFILRIGG